MARHACISKTIGILALPGVQMLDVAGPLDVFAEANVQSGRQVYLSSVVATAEGPIVSSSGLRVLPDMIFDLGAPVAFDTLLIAGAPHLGDGPVDPALLDWLRQSAPRNRRFGSVCSGALVLAATGLLDGRRVTTHWAVAEQLARQFPEVRVEVDALHVRDGPLRTAAGVTAGLDLALALVEEDLGREIAKKVASQLVMFFKRPGGQLQFSRRGEANPVGRSTLQEIQRWVISNPAMDASLAALATRAGLSPRHFARLFRQEIGSTPSVWVETVRVAAARAMLEAGERPKQAAAACGFGDIDTFRRAFQRQVGITPAEYRRRYETVGAA
ncbi:GlxA family transcriptional regulator [Gluconacetobacter tumulicola]|uniref:GlxA family transcriptional regulator n=2 Tax=Gluconacetobacter tumulicola TaxID=1017177 RepID=A0A7W4JGY2_9PROT|nr:GlxA family transcriptional regulator [Gluconacetobacter tumulicola]MBB2181023.1 GlxA family transcriptional regulator [Gluconacetobacter tumulicola]